MTAKSVKKMVRSNRRHMERYEILQSPGRDLDGFYLPSKRVCFVDAVDHKSACLMGRLLLGDGAEFRAILCPFGSEQEQEAERKAN